jgi:hypothetical protein
VEALLQEVEAIPRGGLTRFLRAHTLRFRARLAGLDAPAGLAGLGQAEELFRAMGTPFYLGVVLLEQAELLAVAGRADELEPLRVEAQEIFEQLGATPWLERIAALRVTAAV